jgi:hypothetical protein
LRRERRHKSHRSRYSHGHQEAIGWQNGGGSGLLFNYLHAFFTNTVLIEAFISVFDIYV